jgi:hypothetical protein
MGRFFTRERFGRPQFWAVLLLLVFLAQCLWLVNRSFRFGPDASETFRIHVGLAQWRGRSLAGVLPGAQPSAPNADPAGWRGNPAAADPNHSALWYLVAAAPLLLCREPQCLATPEGGWLAHLPYLVFGTLLGASLWYVSRRLYGNAGGYVALALYCFSPGIIRASACWFAEPEIGAAWGAFGAIWTAVAVAHTLYAPREVVLWNWRRTLLLGLSFALAIGSQYSLMIVTVLSLAFMLYLAPGRRGAAVVIWAAACSIGLVILLASYCFHPGAFLESMGKASFFRISFFRTLLFAYARPWIYRRVLAGIVQSSPALMVAVPAAVIVYIAWDRTRYFGNSVPLLVALLFLALGVGMPQYPGSGFQLLSLPFLFIFVAGIAADLLETAHRNLVRACICALLVSNGLWEVWELLRAGRG